MSDLDALVERLEGECKEYCPLLNCNDCPRRDAAQALRTQAERIRELEADKMDLIDLLPDPSEAKTFDDSYGGVHLKWSVRQDIVERWLEDQSDE